MSNQGARQATFRDIAGTTGAYTGDARAAFEAEATIPAGASYNGAMIAWLQDRLTSTNPNLNGLLAEFAANEGVANWNSLATFSPEA